MRGSASADAVQCYRDWIRAPMLWVEGAESGHLDMFKGSEGGYEARLAAVIEDFLARC